MKLFDWLDHPENVSERTKKLINLLTVLLIGAGLTWAFWPLFRK